MGFRRLRGVFGRVLVAFGLVSVGLAVVAGVPAVLPAAADVAPEAGDGWRVDGLIPGSISAGEYHSCGVTEAGEGFCWGSDYYGQLGNGAGVTDNQVSPSPVADPAGGAVSWASISAGSYHSCGVTDAGDGYCWGYDEDGQLGNGAGVTGDQVSPSRVVDPVGVAVSWASISAGYYHSCGVTDAGDGYCWGNEGNGRLGNGAGVTGDQVSPSRVVDPAGVAVSWASISAGFTHSCGVTDAGEGYCWGNDANGQLGNGAEVTGAQVSPSPVGGAVEWAFISAADTHSCGVTVAGGGFCWGADVFGRLGDGAGVTGNQFSPSLVGASQVIEFEALAGRPFSSEPFEVTVSASSGLGVGVSSLTPLVCSVSAGSMPERVSIQMLDLGVCTLEASQPGDATHRPAESVTRSFTISPLAATIQVGSVDPVYDGSAKALPVTTDPAGLAYEVTYRPAGSTGPGTSTAPVEAGSYEAVVTLVEPGYSADPVAWSFEIAKGTPQVSVGSLGDLVWDITAPSQAVSVSVAPSDLGFELVVSGACTTDGVTVTATAVGSCSVTARAGGGVNWNEVLSGPVVFDVAPGDAEISIVLADLAQTFGATRPVAVTTDPTGLAHSVTYDASPTVPTDAGSYEVHAAVTDPNWEADPVSGTLQIAKAAPVVSISPVTDVVFGSGEVTASASSTSGNPVTLSVSGPCTTTPAAGSIEITPTAGGICTIHANDPGSANWQTGSASVSFTITADETTTVLTGPPDATSAGTDAVFTATVSSTGTAVPQGQVTFTADTREEVVPLVDGVAIWSVSDLPVGSIEVTAAFEATTSFNGSMSDPVTHHVDTETVSLTGLPATVNPGDIVDVEARGFWPDEQVSFTLHSDPVEVGVVTADLYGTATLTFTIPDLNPGAHHLTAVGLSSQIEAQAQTSVIRQTPVDPNPGPNPDPDPEPPTPEQPDAPETPGDPTTPGTPADPTTPGTPGTPTDPGTPSPDTGQPTRPGNQPADTTAAPLPRTGFNPIGLAGLGAALTLAGIALTLTNQQRRRPTPR